MASRAHPYQSNEELEITDDGNLQHQTVENIVFSTKFTISKLINCGEHVYKLIRI